MKELQQAEAGEAGTTLEEAASVTGSTSVAEPEEPDASAATPESAVSAADLYKNYAKDAQSHGRAAGATHQEDEADRHDPSTPAILGDESNLGNTASPRLEEEARKEAEAELATIAAEIEAEANKVKMKATVEAQQKVDVAELQKEQSVVEALKLVEVAQQKKAEEQDN